MSTLPAALGEQVVAHFRTYDHDHMWADNWAQSETNTNPDVPGTSTSIQGVVCCVDRDNTTAWLLMLVEDTSPFVVSFLATEFSRNPTQPWHWIDARDDLDACRKFVNWLESNDELPPAERVVAS